DKPSLTMGIVELSVQDIKGMTDFYTNIVGFELVSTGVGISNLGDKNQIFLRLIEEKNYSIPVRGEAGLYHTAITHNNRKDVANRVARILEKTPERYQGSSDHSATEAFYFSDPEGNGLELYYDRPRSEWKYKDGKPVMGSSYIDVNQYLKKYKDLPISEGETKMGHVHLKIGNIAMGKEFYENILMFDNMSTTDTALFVSRDGYNHNLGMNTWESLGATKKAPKTYGLRSFELIYHDINLYSQIRENLEKNSFPILQKNNGIQTEDPWGNIIIISKK
ncbi:VOC family protein, partial [Candidatus Gracilibacteria bacterium]|nr:VOC family protein [Candidatus Gracilibacteria bacterium]